MRFTGMVLAVLVLAPAAFARDAKCKQCGVKFARENAVRFGMLSFCSDACKDEFREADRALGECSGCGIEVKGDHREFVSGNTRYIKIGQRPDWDGYCAACRGDVKTGQELGTNRARIEAAADDAEWRAENPEEPAARVKKKRETDADAEGGFGVLGYVLVTVGVLFGLFKFFLKS